MNTKNVCWILSNSGKQANFQSEGDLEELRLNVNPYPQQKLKKQVPNTENEAQGLY